MARKAVSTVIATLLMLIITIGLAGVAYIYIQGTVTSVGAKQMDIVSADCRAGNSFYVTVRNLDSFTDIATSAILVKVDSVPVTTITWSPTTVSKNGGVSVGTITNPAGGTAGTPYKISVTGPSNADQMAAYC